MTEQISKDKIVLKEFNSSSDTEEQKADTKPDTDQVSAHEKAGCRHRKFRHHKKPDQV